MEKMKKNSLILMAALTFVLGLTGCQVKTVDNSIVSGMADDYSGMRDNTDVFDASEEKENIDRGIYKGGIKDGVLAEAIPEYSTEPETEPEEIKDEIIHVIGDYYAGGNSQGVSGNSSSSSSSNKNNNSSSSTTAASDKNKAPTNNTVADKNNTSSVNTSDISSNTEDKDKNNNSTDDDKNPEKRKNPASMIINGTKYNVYITIEGYYRGNKALRKLNSYNGNHAIEYDMNIPSGYEPVIVQFTVTAGENIPNDDNTLIPEIRVKNGSGESFDEYPTYVNVLRMGDYSDEDSETKSYDAVFEMPSDEDDFQVIFGSSTGNTYRFKSTQLDRVED